MDTNLLFYALDADSPRHPAALAFLASLQDDENVALSEIVLAELYCLVRNPVVLRHPLDAGEAAAVVQTWRSHPRWRLIGFPTEGRPLHDALWALAARRGFAFRRLYDARLALTLRAHGVTAFATANVKDFQGFGFRRVWNPLAEPAASG